MAKRSFKIGDLVVLRAKKNPRPGLAWLKSKEHKGECVFRIRRLKFAKNWRLAYVCERMCCQDDPNAVYWAGTNMASGHGHTFFASWLELASDKRKEELLLLMVLRDVKD